MFSNISEEFKQIRWKPILVPPEHGIWGFTIEALILGLLFSFQNNVKESLLIAFLMVINPFFKQSLKIFFQDIYHKRTFLRKYVAFFVCITFAILYLFILYFIYKNSLYFFWIWILMGIILGIIIVIFEIIGYYQNPILEIAGSMIPSFFAISMNSISEFQTDILFFIFLVLFFRNFTSILLVREIVDILKIKNSENKFFWFIFAFSIFIALILYFYFFINFSIFFIMLLYLFSILVLYHLSTRNIIKKPQTIGWNQILIGILYVILIYYKR